MIKHQIINNMEVEWISKWIKQIETFFGGQRLKTDKHLALIDFEEAYDFVPWQNLYNILKKIEESSKNGLM